MMRIVGLAVGILLGVLGIQTAGFGEGLDVRECGAAGSKFETKAETKEGAKEITVADVGDFKVGQGITVSRCNVRCTNSFFSGPGSPYGGRKPLEGVLEYRGYDGTAGGWLVYILEIQSANPPTFRWSDDLVKGYKWTATRVPVTFDWQKLSNGIEVRFLKRDLEPGHMMSFTLRDQLVSTIEKIENKTITLGHPANRAATGAVVRHNDTRALQAAIDKAIREKRNVFFPTGWYRLTNGLSVKADSIRLEGASGVDTVMDITDGQGSIFDLRECTDATVRNFRMIGHTGYEDRAGSFTTSSGHGFWACALKGCNAVGMYLNERVLIENVHASRMASECFYAWGTGRTSKGEQKRYQKSIVYLRCSVTDCAANAFNNNDMGENTSVLYCRVDGAPWHAAEMPTRFLKLVGNYVRNAGPFTIGDMSHRSEDLNNLGCGQAIVTDNVFEGIGQSGGIVVNHGSSQVVIANNLFINFNGPAITASSFTVRAPSSKSFPSNTVTITGNIIDMTSVGDKGRARTGITVSTSDTIVADNQIYVRGQCDPQVTGISIAEPAVNVVVHDNLVKNCAYGIRTGRAAAAVSEVIDPTTFLENNIPLEWHRSHLYRGWNLAWLSGANANTVSIIDSLDPETLRFKLAKPCQMKLGDRFQVFTPGSANWEIHDNTVTGCLNPVVLDSWGSGTSFFRKNIVSRGEAAGVKQAVEVRGAFKLVGNHISGFDEPSCSALALHPDPTGKAYRVFCRENVFERCANVVSESQKGLWDAASGEGNLYIDCGNAPKTAATQAGGDQITATLIAGPKKAVLRAPRLAAPVAVDGDVGEWPWKDEGRAAPLAQTPAGDPVATPMGHVCAACDDAALYLAARIPVAKGAKVRGGDKWGGGDGLEVSFQCAEGKAPTPIFLLWLSSDGKFEAGPYGGASAAQIEALQKTVAYAARVGAGEWSCEARIPFATIGVDPAAAKKLLFNIGLHQTSDDQWYAWMGTGAALYMVDRAGDLMLER